MQRSSDSIASLAAALAKAQIDLSNPEKSLVGTIETQAGEGGQRLFRYAPLSSGIEIVRKTLGQHEIATVQTTAIDQSAGIVNFTTVLAHASGEWIAPGLASLRHQRDRHPASYGRSFNLCPALCAVHAKHIEESFRAKLMLGKVLTHLAAHESIESNGINGEPDGREPACAQFG